jgi:hypothetical protein
VGSEVGLAVGAVGAPSLSLLITATSATATPLKEASAEAMAPVTMV